MDLKLEPISETHAPSLAHHGNSENVFSGLRGVFVPPYRLEDALEFIRAALQDFRSRTFAVVYEGTPIGVITLSFKEDVYRFNGEIGYWIGESFWNRGITTEAIRLLLEIAFSEHGFHSKIRKRFKGTKSIASMDEKESKSSVANRKKPSLDGFPRKRKFWSLWRLRKNIGFFTERTVIPAN
ncbi:GNAT family N-acetyltransferase [Leptospira ellisii]|uniref:GNAT family N-acetyltransferase n=1 Tax=Leptospira ellisii TaxID=2023197 RepID=UPI000F63D3CE|nr:GNAT family N-acetyltransferase [Leptospira ellisii]